MSITRKRQKFIDEYFVDLNATQAAIRAGYAETSAYSIASEILSIPEVKAEVAKRMADSRMTADEVVKRLQGMADGSIATKIIVVDEATKEEYDVLTACDKMGKIYALFVDKQVIELEGLEIIDDDEEE